MQVLLVLRDLLDHLGLPENLVCQVFLVFLVYLVVLDLLAFPVVLLDILQGMQVLLVLRDLLDHLGLPVCLVCPVFLKDQKC
jgi:hypothetical protein